MKKRTVRQVGYLQGLYRDARPTEHKKIVPYSVKYLKRMAVLQMVVCWVEAG